MASETTLTSHQRSYNDLKSLVESGHGIAVHEYRRDDGTLMRRYVVAYNAEGNPVRRSELKRALDSGDNGLEAPKIKQINALAQTIIDSHRKANDSTPEQQRQAAFYTRGGIHYVKSDEVDREKSYEHKKQSLKMPERTSYDHAFGGVVGGVTGEQREVLDFGPTLVGKAPDEDISAELNALKDKNFVQIFRSTRAKAENSGKPLEEIYTKALQKYTIDTVKAFQVSLDPDSALEVSKSLQKAAHKIAEPSTLEDALSETWLDNHVADLGTRSTAEAVFQAIQDVGAKEVGVDPDKHTQTTADHAYQALISKVNQFWVETNRDTSIHEASFVDLPVGGSSVGGSTPPHGAPHSPLDEPHGTTSVNAKDILAQPSVDRKTVELERKIERADQLHSQIMGVSTGIIFGRNPNYNEEIEAIIRDVADEFPDIYDHPDFRKYRGHAIPASEEQNVCSFLALKPDEIRQEIASTKGFYRDPVQFAKDLKELKNQRNEKAEELTHAWRGPLGSKSTIQRQIDELDAKIAVKEAVLKKWETLKGRAELLTVYLHQGNGIDPQPADYQNLYDKIIDNTTDSAVLTPGEIGALQTWKLPESVDPSSLAADTMISILMTHLTESLMTIALEDMGTTITDVDTSTGEYPLWRDSGHQRVRGFIKGAKFLKFEMNPAELGNSGNKEALFALRLAHDAAIHAEPSLTEGTEDWKTAMLKSLQEEAFKAITPELEKRAGILGTDLLTIRGTDPANTATHYLHIHEYLKGEDRDLTSEEIHALLNLLPAADSLEGHQKFEFLQQQALQHYTHLRMEEETLGQNLGGWTPTEDHLSGAKLWLRDPTQAAPNDDVKKALLLVKPDNASGIGQVEAKLDQAIRIAKLEASAVDPDGYDYTTEDVQAVQKHLEGSGSPLTEDQIKAFKKMQANEALPAAKDRPTHYQRKVAEAMGAATASKYSGRAVDLKNVWDYTANQLTGLTADTLAPVPNLRDTYLSAITKLTTTPLTDLTPEEKSVVFKHHDWIQKEKGADTEVFKGFFLLVLLERHTPVA